MQLQSAIATDSTRSTVQEPEFHVDAETRGPASGTKLANGIAMHAYEHVVQFYETDACLLDAVATFCGDAIQAGDAAIVIATPEHRAGIAERLQTRSLIGTTGCHERYLSLDAAETLSRLVANGEVDAKCFLQVLGEIISRAAERGRQVRVFGEMVALLVADGHPAAAIRLEELWNDPRLRRNQDFSLFCAYPMGVFVGATHGELFRDVCQAHNHVIPAESYSGLSTESDRLRAIAQLQQKAQSLAAEVAERQRIEEQLEQSLAAEQTARIEAESALCLRDEFLSIAAHELRNPLAGLSLHTQVALRRLRHDEHPDTARTEQALQAISAQATRLARLLDRLLDVSRLDAGKLILERRPTDLTILVEQAVTSARAWSDRHPITLETPASLDARIDPVRLAQVLANLLDNAIKYSPDGEPIEVVLSQPAPGTVELLVGDRGTGIPPDARERIFERFFQARGTDAARGLGLGLYVSQQIVELHGGQIRADFPPDGGTRIVVSLPVGMEAVEVIQAAD